MKRGTAESYRVFVRDWWRRAEKHEPQGYTNEGVPVVPYPGAPEHTLAKHCTEDEARALCKEYNATHKPGWASRKAEYDSE